MKAATLPVRGIFIVEGDPQIRKHLLRDLRPLAKKVLDFSDSPAALRWVEDPTHHARLELILVVADRVGIAFMAKVGRNRPTYPLARKILYSGGGSEEAVADWKKAGVIDSYIPKGYYS